MKGCCAPRFSPARSLGFQALAAVTRRSTQAASSRRGGGVCVSKNIQFQEWETASWPSLATLFLGDYCSATIQHRLGFCSYSNTPHRKGVMEPGKELQHQMRVMQKNREFSPGSPNASCCLWLTDICPLVLRLKNLPKRGEGEGGGKVAQ